MATADAPTPVPRRATEADRERVARFLQARSVEGSISTDTFIARVERALTARSRAELDDLVADVRSPGPLRRAALAAVAWLSALSGDLQAAWRAPRVPVLALPREEGRSVTIGRAPDCDFQLADTSVSRRHAELWRDGDRWLLKDLGSLNGTRLNGMRVTEEVEVRPGDHISLAGVRFRAAARAR
jgi:hypothetical protein